jgi:argininosuccinate lyase
MKLWGGRFTKGTHSLVDEYNASISFDYQLAEQDIQGSIAHAQMLGKCNLLSTQEVNSICSGLDKISKKIKKGEIAFQLSDEDIHMNIERLLHEDVGEVAGKLHTGRSRNDQVALDIHLYLRQHIVLIVSQLHELLTTIQNIAHDHVDTFIPGYTHLQRAEPIRFAHHMLAYFNMFSRDVQRLCDSFIRVNQSPLGAGAMAGSGFAVDRDYVASQLNFAGIYTNSLDAVSDRDFVVEFLSHAALIMMHFSRLSEEMVLWSSHEFGFIQLDDAFSTGSSMMPQKKNPDICELARGKTGRVYGSLMGLLTTLKGLPLAYNKDLQEDKEGLFDTIKTLTQTLAVYTPMLASMHVNKETMQKATETDYSNATNLANYLTQKNIPFRIAHEITGKIVMYGIEQNKLLKQIDLFEFKSFCDKIDEDVYLYLDIEAVIEAHRAAGGTSKQSVETQLEQSKKILQETANWLQTHASFLHKE